MHIKTFEKDIDQKILVRGKLYLADGLVRELSLEDEGSYHAWVDGTDLYEVEAQIDENGEIISISCDCPYDWGEYCKHQAAVLFAIREQREHASAPQKDMAQKKKQDLQSVLLAQTKESLVEYLLGMAKQDRGLRQSLLFQFGSQEDEMEQSRKLVKEHMRPFGPGRFWEYGEVNNALEGAWTVLDRARLCAETDCARSVGLCLAVLPEAVDLLSYCDDSGGEVGEVISTCIITMEKAIQAGLHILPAEKRAALFRLILAEAMADVYNGWEDFRVDMLKILVLFCQDKPLLEKLSQVLEQERVRNQDKPYRYYSEAVATLQLDLLERLANPQQARQFIADNLAFTSFRKRAIENAMSSGEYAVALRLAEDGILQDKEFAGLLHDWRTAAYRAYEAMGDKAKIREMAEHFVLNERDGFAYYAALKGSYPPAQWPEALGKLLTAFEAQKYPYGTYADVLLAEKEFDRLLAYCRSHMSCITRLAKEFPEQYSTAASDIYRQLILQRASTASDRSRYKEVCGLLRGFGAALGTSGMAALAQELKTAYPRRPAFLDELRKLGK